MAITDIKQYAHLTEADVEEVRPANWTRSEPTSKSPGANGTPGTCAGPSSCSARWRPAAESP